MTTYVSCLNCGKNWKCWDSEGNQWGQ
jgi:hypothetical protein